MYRALLPYGSLVNNSTRKVAEETKDRLCAIQKKGIIRRYRGIIQKMINSTIVPTNKARTKGPSGRKETS